LLDQINNREDIDSILNNSFSEDNESNNFEIKGTAGIVKLTKEVKQNIAKEISAFANTYGGILLIHNGVNTEIVEFNDTEVVDIYAKLESWLGDSLEPRINGIESKVVSNLILIKIPQSMTKPHRTTGKMSTYYYRHITQSKPMPEIMISAMYRSQEFLEVTCSLMLNEEKNSQLEFYTILQNNSNLAGTCPKIYIHLYSPSKIKLKLYPKGNARPNNTEIVDFQNKGKLPEADKISVAFTGEGLNSRVLYPHDHIVQDFTTNSSLRIAEIKTLAVRIEYMLKETKRFERYFLFERSEIFEDKKLAHRTNFTNEQVVLNYMKIREN